MANLRASAVKSEVLAMEEEIEQVLDVPVAQRMTSLGLRMGFLDPDQAVGGSAPPREGAIHRTTPHATDVC